MKTSAGNERNQADEGEVMFVPITKFCKDCRYHDSTEYYDKCTHPVHIEVVHGRLKSVRCDDERKYGSCGKNGDNFSKKVTP